MIRLHKHAAFLMVGDVEALAELAAIQGVRSTIGPKLSSTVAWVDHHRVGTLQEALRQAGYLPRLRRDETPDGGDSAG
jgi:hypothetical protein